jgi:hypothetical protein
MSVFSAIGHFFTSTLPHGLDDAYHGIVDVLGAVGMVAGAALGVVGWSGSWVLSKLTGGRVTLFQGFKHTVLSSALGWGSLLAVFSPYVRTHFVGPTDNQLARDWGAVAATGTQIPDTDVIGPVGSGDVIASVPASWGFRGPIVIHDFVGPIIAEPFTDIAVPASSVSAGTLTVPTPGLIGALPTP